jgi:group I intron endonuclease
MGWIYMIKNNINGKCYIGQTKARRVQSRWANHKNRPHGLLKLAFEKYGIENFSFEIITEVSDDDLNEIEISEISLRNTVAPRGYNLEKGGRRSKIVNDITKNTMKSRMLGTKLSPETRYKISEAAKTRPPISEETRRKLSISNKGKTVSEETKLKISEANKGRQISEETRKKLSDSAKNRVFTEETRQKLRESAKNRHTISEETRLKMSEASRGRVLSEETRAKMSLAKMGHSVSQETRDKISLSHSLKNI